MPLLDAFLLKGMALAAWLLLPPAAAAAILVAVVAYFTYTIAHPRSQAWVPVVCSLPGDEVCLTFDDGPSPESTGRILDILAEHGAKATFFVVGERAARHPDLIRRIHAEGHTIGTHTQHHRVGFHFGSPGHVRREVEEAIAAVGAIVPGRRTLFRPPQGLRTPAFAQGWRGLAGLTCVTWTARGRDGVPTTAAKIEARLAPHIKPGSILVLHDGRTPATLEALPRILARCRDAGLRCAAMTEPPSAGGAGPDADRYPYKSRLPAVVYWPFRALRTAAVAFCFACFWGGAVIFAWIGLPLLALFGGGPEERMRRAQRALRLCFRAFHGLMRGLRLYRPTAVTATARPGGAEARTPAVLVANHPTLCDVTAIGSLYPNVVCLARADFAENLFMGRLIRLCGYVPWGIHMLDECEARLAMGFDVLIFPEGTRSPFAGGLQPFKRGAFELAMRARAPLVLLRLTCRPKALTKRLPIWKHSDRQAELRIEAVETILPAAAGRDSKALCREVERRYHELLSFEEEKRA